MCGRQRVLYRVVPMFYQELRPALTIRIRRLVTTERTTALSVKYKNKFYVTH